MICALPQSYPKIFGTIFLNNKAIDFYSNKNIRFINKYGTVELRCVNKYFQYCCFSMLKKMVHYY